MRHASLLAGIAAIVAAMILCGCYPAFLTSRPRARIIVTDEVGAPLEGATVTLATKEWHGIVGQNTFEKFLTSREGKVKFGSQHDWAVQILLPDGDTHYSWSLCVSKPGFEAIPMSFMNFDEPIKVAMYPGNAPSDCEWRKYEDIPRVKEREERWIEVEGGEWASRLGYSFFMDEKIRDAMEVSARQQGIQLRSWSEYRFQYQARGAGDRDRRVFVHAFCRAPADFDLSKAFYSEPDDGVCFFDTTYTTQTYTDQPPPAFGPLQSGDGS